MQTALYAKTIIKRLTFSYEGKVQMHELPNFDDLPEWVAEAWEEGLLLMSEDDDYKNLWLGFEYGDCECGEHTQGMAIRARPNDIVHYSEDREYPISIWMEAKGELA